MNSSLNKEPAGTKFELFIGRFKTFKPIKDIRNHTDTNYQKIDNPNYVVVQQQKKNSKT